MLYLVLCQFRTFVYAQEVYAIPSLMWRDILLQSHWQEVEETSMAHNCEAHCLLGLFGLTSPSPKGF